MALSRSVAEPECEVIDLVSWDDENVSVSFARTGKRSREDGNAGSSHDRAAKKGISFKETSHPALSKEARQQNFTCMPFINADVPDNAIVTDGIMPLLHRLNQLPGVITVSGRNPFLPTHALLLHFKQKDSWSCGFRNTQMMLTALLPQLQSHHAFFQSVPASLKPYPMQDNRPIPIPSLHQLQTFLQDSWANGFDQRGALHYQRNIVGKSREIGAMEVSTILSYLYVDTAVVQFINCHESRALLGPWIWNYFLRGPCFVCDWAAHNISCLDWANQLLDTTARNLSESTDSMNVCACPALPLYLQWNGHSVTAVGAEKTKAGDIYLLMFDPMKSGSELRQALSSSNRKNVPSLMRLSTKSLLKQKVNCQVLMSSPRPLTAVERNAIRECSSVNVTTAAFEAVQRSSQG